MSYKYRRKRKVKLTTNKIILLILVMFLALGTGYALWSTDLKINGTAKAKMEVVDPDEGKPLDITILPAGNGKYANILFPYSTKFVSDEIVNNKLTTTIKVNPPIYATKATVSFLFTNSSSDIYNNGKISVSVTGSNDAIKSDDPKFSINTNLLSGATCQFSDTLPYDFSKIQEETTVKYTFSYEVNGEVKVFYYLIVIQP